jgi:SAM-dependent methyltransferase
MRSSSSAWSAPATTGSARATWPPRARATNSRRPCSPPRDWHPGQRVLDLASGPGLLARAAVGLVGGRGLVIASDISQGQLACCPDLPRVAADGEALPFADASFDRVLCGLGLMFFPDDQAALGRNPPRAGAARTPRPVGLGRAEEVPLVECALSCMRRLLPPPKVARPSIFRFGDPANWSAVSPAPTFAISRSEPFRLHIDFADAAAYWQGFLDLAGGAAESLSRLPAEKQQALAAAVAEDLAPHAVAGGYRLTSTVLLATARPV